MANFKKCEKGHFYDADKEAECPYCKPANTVANAINVDKTIPQNNLNETEFQNAETIGPDNEKTVQNNQNNNADKTMIFSNNQQSNNNIQSKPKSQQSTFNPDKTIIGGINTETDNDNNGQQKAPVSSRRKLTGWIVSYELDPFGIAFSIYEGRNKVGRAITNDITISDGTVTDLHAILLFRNGKFYIIDQGSSNGTYVNGEDTDFQTVELKDNDIITFGKGKAVFKFKQAF